MEEKRLPNWNLSSCVLLGIVCVHLTEGVLQATLEWPTPEINSKRYSMANKYLFISLQPGHFCPTILLCSFYTPSLSLSAPSLSLPASSGLASSGLDRDS